MTSGVDESGNTTTLIDIRKGSNVTNMDVSSRCRARHPQLVMYNRLPKCGSSTMRVTIIQLGKDNEFCDIHNGVGAQSLPEWNRSVMAIQARVEVLEDGTRVFVANKQHYTRGLLDRKSVV